MSKQFRTTLLFLCIVAPIGFCLFFFEVRSNFRVVVPQKVYRSAQPSNAQIKEWVGCYGIKTLINLRGDAGRVTVEEQATADELGIKMVSLRISSKRLPARYKLVELIRMIETAEPPVLIHCRSGIDRAGTASVLAAMAIGKVDYDTAKWQSYVPPGPWKRKRYHNRIYFHDYLHISDVFKFYEKYCRSNGLDVNNWQQFKQWVNDTNSLPEVEPI